jgi:hypothetical protein
MSSFDQLGIDLDFNGFRANQFRVEAVATLPAFNVADKGRFYELPTGQVYFNNGTILTPIDATQVVGGIPIGALTVNPLDRGSHTGTQLASTISDFDTRVRTNRLDQLAAPTGPVSFGNQRQTNVAPAVSGTDGVNLDQLNAAVQASAAGIDNKPAVQWTTTAPITLSGLAAQGAFGPFTAGDRILVGGQGGGLDVGHVANGVYIAAAGAWTRATDVITSTSFWLAQNNNAQYMVGNTGGAAIVLGTTPIIISQFGASAAYTASNGVTLVGNDFRGVVAAGGGLLVGAGGFSLDPAVAAKKFQVTVGGAATFAVNHNLNNDYPQVSVYRISDKRSIGARVVSNSANQVQVTFGSSVAASSHVVSIVG